MKCFAKIVLSLSLSSLLRLFLTLFKLITPSYLLSISPLFALRVFHDFKTSKLLILIETAKIVIKQITTSSFLLCTYGL